MRGRSVSLFEKVCQAVLTSSEAGIRDGEAWWAGSSEALQAAVTKFAQEQVVRALVGQK